MGLALRILPCDISMWWNSTYDMLCFAVEYRQAIERMTSDWKNNLHQFELEEDKWLIVTQLKDMLEVHDILCQCDTSLPLTLP